MSVPVAVIIPTLNESANMGRLLAQLVCQPPELLVDVIVADGGSTDGTLDVVAAAAALDPRIRLIDNPAGIQSAGVNRAAACADRRAKILVRIDAHASYPDNYIPRIVATFSATSATMVAVGLRTVGTTCLQRGIAAASNSRIGTGGAAHRIQGGPGFVDHGHHAGIDRLTFERLGGYDETFIANEDAEFDLRVRRAGGRIWLADLQIGYQPRASVGRLASQYYRYGQGRAQTFLKHGERLRLRQCLPPLLVVMLTLVLVFSTMFPALLIVPGLYVAALGVATLTLFAASRQRCSLLAGPAAATMHLAWGSGFIAMLLRGSSRARRPRTPGDQQGAAEGS